MTGYWTTDEIKLALQEGYKLKEIHSAILYEKKYDINIFTDYIKQLYKQRQKYKKEGNPIQHTIKLYLNSLYGKLAQVKTKKIPALIPLWKKGEYDKQGYYPVYGYSNTNEIYMEKKLGEKLPKHAIPIIPIYITSLARIRMYNEMKKIPQKDLLYIDTDGIIFKGNHQNKFNIGKELGQWKIEKQKAFCEIVKEKVYRINDEYKWGGKKDRSPEEWEQFVKGQPVMSQRTYTEKMALKTGNFDKIGSFYKAQITLNPTMKRERKYPNYIKEELKPLKMTQQTALT